MTWLHVHLLVNHLPVIGTVVLLSLLIYAVAYGKTALIETTLTAFALLAVAGVGVYLTGEPAEGVAERMPSFSDALLESHEEAALVATILLAALGAVALGGVVAFRRRAQAIPTWFARLALVLATVATCAMGYTAWRGGQLGHPEIRAESAATIAHP
jgi:hypothetical protein